MIENHSTKSFPSIDANKRRVADNLKKIYLKKRTNDFHQGITLKYRIVSKIRDYIYSVVTIFVTTHVGTFVHIYPKFLCRFFD